MAFGTRVVGLQARIYSIVFRLQGVGFCNSGLWWWSECRSKVPNQGSSVQSDSQIRSAEVVLHDRHS